VLATYKCSACESQYEEYFGLSSQAPSFLKCPKCGKIMRKTFGHFNTRAYSVVPGYEKEHQDRMTMGKTVDFKQKWV